MQFVAGDRHKNRRSLSITIVTGSINTAVVHNRRIQININVRYSGKTYVPYRQ
ncbi:MAG TPA: hypothetical protein PKE07_12005 [Lacibacter sp.]|nr:hypothetical protein [Lacibacter sp.]HMO88925.1 hypothetical protein [Lacibacter sp.]